MPKCLSIHAAYHCRHSGACCRAGWAIPFSADEFVNVSRLPLESGQFHRDTNGGIRAAQQPDGTCAFLDSSVLCTIHRLGSMAALPVSCRMFPRIVLHDARGTFISLSHFCPTAAAMLFGPSDGVTIVEAPEGLAGVGDLDGLDARTAWPPLLRPGVLMDPDSYGLWEARALNLLTRRDRGARAALQALSDSTAALTRWSPGAESLSVAVERVFDLAAPGDDSPEIAGRDAPIQRWLAARLFGNWIAYQADGIAAIVRYLERCLDTLTAELAADNDLLEAIRRSDLRILHQTDQ